MNTAAKGGGVRQLTWLLVWAVVFCDIGTSVYYVPGILYDRFGSLAPFFVLITAFGFVLLAFKYVEIVQRTPQGGGVVAIGDMAFGETIGALGGMFIVVDFFLTCAISSVSGFYYLSSVFESLAGNIPLFACVALGLLALVNIRGLRESAALSLLMAASALVTNLVVVVVMVVQLSPAEWKAMLAIFEGAGHLTGRELLIGFGAGWLAFSGLETISQLAPVMREPLGKTARLAMIGVVVTVLVTSPTLALLSVGVLPGAAASGAIDAVESERMISQLASLAGGNLGSLLSLAVVATAAALLLFAANTAIIGTYHVFVALSERRYFPDRLKARHSRYNTPYKAIIVATVVPMAVILVTQGRMDTLGDMYAFGLLGAFIIESGGLDILRWRDGQRGTVFWVGLLPTAMVVVAWLVNIVEKPQATFFGGSIAALGMLWGWGLRTGRIKDVVYSFSMVAEKRSKQIAAVDVSEISHDIISLQQAEEITRLMKSSTLIALSGVNPDVVSEGVRRAKGMGESALYSIFVEEWPGLFPSEAGVLPGPVGIEALTRAAEQAADQGVELLPVWAASHSAAEAIAEAARRLGVGGVIVGVSRRSALGRALKGQVVRKLTKQLPETCRLVICD